MKLLQTKDYLLLIDEEAEIEINESTYDFEICPCFGKNKHTEGIVWSFDDKRMHVENFIETTQTGDSGYDIIKINGYRLYPIIAYRPLTKEAKELDLPLLPPFESSNVEEDAYEEFSKTWSFGEHGDQVPRKFFLAGYKAATKQFSLEDIKYALNQLADEAEYGISNFAREAVITKIIQSLSTQQLPKGFIPDYEYQTREGEWKSVLLPSEWFGSDEGDNPKRLKTTVNLDGKEELVGTYKY